MRFRTFFLIFFLAELTSFTGYFFPWLNTVGFFAIIAAAFVLSMRRLKYGLYFMLADLILGGKTGALFSFIDGGFLLSLRMALFIIVMGVWVGKVVSAKLKMLGTSPLTPPRQGGETGQFIPILKGRLGGVMTWWGLLGLAVAWGIVVGLVRGNDFGNLFLDANGYFYGALILPAWWVVMRMNANEREWMRMFGVVFFAATTLLALKTLFSVYLFTHGLNNFIAANLIPFYRWIRDTGVGEITGLEGNFARVFFQSHIYNIAAFFVILNTVILRSRATKDPGFFPFARLRFRMTNWKTYALLFLNTSVIVVSLSRSFWVGVIAGLFVLGFAVIKFHSSSLPPARAGRTQAGQPSLNLRRGALTILSGFLGATVLIFVVARFPYPRPSDADLAQATQSRFQFEAGAASRWNLLPVLWSAVREYPVFGSGFGRTVTYISNDPRVREVSVTGEYETYAFEWGWFDFWLKFGIIGLTALFGLLFTIARALYKNGELAGLAVLSGLAAIHFFTPYLNHPLGLGLLIGLSVLTLRNFHQKS